VNAAAGESDMSTDVTIGMIQGALNDFGLRAATVQHLESTNHCNAKIITGSDDYFLKILADDCTESHLRSRLQFLSFLREGGLSIPASIATTSGQPFSRVPTGSGERLATLSRWIDGQTLRDRTDEHWIERCGKLLAQLHFRSQTFHPDDRFKATVWDGICAPPDSGWFQSFLADAALDAAAREIIDRAAARTRTIHDRLPKDRSNYGLIHADFHGDNLIFDGRRIWIVDFDDVGWGYFLFDVGWPAVLFAKHHPEVEGFLAPFLQGYEQVRPLSDVERELLPDFRLAAGIGALEMVHSSPVANDAPLAQEWFRTIVEWFRVQLAGIENGK
jgi:Ser/Thr protein kinase RdoA (MazF antagonist)